MVVPPEHFTWLQLQLQDANKNFSVAMLHCRILQLLYQVLGCDLTMLQSLKKTTSIVLTLQSLRAVRFLSTSKTPEVSLLLPKMTTTLLDNLFMTT